MNIILVSGRLAKARTLTLSVPQMAAIGVVLVLTPLLLAALLFYLALFHAADIKHPYLQAVILSAQQEQAAKNREYLQENLNAMAARLGQMQAQVVRLEALGDRLARMAGVAKEFNFQQAPSRGGAESASQRSLSRRELERETAQLSRTLEDRSDQLAVLETAWLQQRSRQSAMPNARPVPGAWSSSSFGWRIDPFTAKRAFHEGLDFMAEVGTPIRAAAGGIVVFADVDTGYGKMVQIDHGNGFVTRYAHASKLVVKVGDIVMKGQKIAEVGNTGRSSGPHLHFEVRYQGAVQNPVKYLESAS